MNIVFNNRVECEDALRKALNASGNLVENDNAVIEAFAYSCHDEKAASRIGLELQIWRWVVKDDDLEIFKIVKDALVTLAATSFALKDLNTAAITSLVLGLIALLRNAVRSGAKLTDEQVVVLTILRTVEAPVSANYLAGRLSPSNGRAASASWTVERVLKVLRSLTEIVTKKDVVALVRSVKQNESECWIAVGN